MTEVKRILLECTHTHDTDMNTGIQRVVRNIIKQSKQVGRELNVKCLPVIVVGNRFLAVDRTKTNRSFRAVAIDFLKKTHRQLDIIISKIIPFPAVRRFLFPLFLQTALAKLPVASINVMSLVIVSMKYRWEKIAFKKGDVLLLMDSSWSYPIWPTVKRAKQNGAIIGLMIYDIIAVTNPEFFYHVTAKRFHEWSEQSVSNVDFYIAISKTVRNQIASYIISNKQPDIDPGRFESFQLGSVIDKVEFNGKVRDELKTIFENDVRFNTYLSVGTLEPRKNHKYLMDAFDNIWQECPNACLCIVGHTGWLSEQLRERILSHKAYGRYLFMFHDALDTELDYCYNHAKALIFPSHAEGFGLPIVESLYHGLPVLASDIPIHREVGKDLCTYFDISDPACLAKIIINIEKTGKLPDTMPPECHKLPDWKDSCRELLEKALLLSARCT